MKNLSMDFWIYMYQPEQKASNVVDHANWPRIISRVGVPRLSSLSASEKPGYEAFVKLCQNMSGQLSAWSDILSGTCRKL